MLRKIALVLIMLLFVVGCSAPEPGQDAAQIKKSSTGNLIPIKAVYLTPEQGGQISADELKQFPEIKVIHTFDQLKNSVGQKVAIWIDKDAVKMVNSIWLNSPPQRKYPLVLVGYNNGLYSFREVLNVGEIEGPRIDWNTIKLEPGFSVWMIKTETENSQSAYLSGYKEVPTAAAILDVTSQLLEGKSPQKTDNDRLNDAISEVSLAHGEQNPHIAGYVLTTHGQINSLAIWGKSLGVPDSQEEYLVYYMVNLHLTGGSKGHNLLRQTILK